MEQKNNNKKNTVLDNKTASDSALKKILCIVEHIPNLVLSITPDGEVEYANPAVKTVTGFTKRELIANGLSVIFAENVLADIKKKHIPDALHGDTVQFETVVTCKDGEKLILAVSIFKTGRKSLGIIFRNMTKIRKLEEQNFYDGLTNIYNRRFFDESMNRTIKSLSRSSSSLSLLMIDIDFFKKYNDTYGHAAGDACLKIVANTLTGCMQRADDFVARYGGEEFVAVLPNTDESGARVVAERLLAAIQEKRMPHEKSDAADYVTISIGGVTGLVKHTHTADDFIKSADEMLYKSKRSGRNQYNSKAFD